jgi:uncharacterized protein
MPNYSGKLALVTGASSGIGLELARIAAQDGYDLLIGADRYVSAATEELRQYGTQVTSVEVDLGTFDGVDRLLEAAGGRPIDALFANAGQGHGRAFLDQDVSDWLPVIQTNVLGTTYILHKVGQQMRERNQGKILITGSIAGLMPGSFQAVYNATKAYDDSLSDALRNELKDTDITVTVLMPGPTETDFFERGDMMDTQVGTDDRKEDPAVTARHGYDALEAGHGHVVSGWKNKVQAVLAHVTPQAFLAERHRQMAEPGTAAKND